MRTISKSLILSIFIFSFSLSLLAQEKTKAIVTTKFAVKGLCGMCKDRIENASLIKGVKFTEWDRDSDTLTVIYKPKKVDILDVHKSVAKAGHETDKVKANMEAYDKLPACCKYLDGEKH